jgi:hypothetical protein
LIDSYRDLPTGAKDIYLSTVSTTVDRTGGGTALAVPPPSYCQPFVADQVSVLPKVPGQSASGHGAGSARWPAASDAAR